MLASSLSPLSGSSFLTLWRREMELKYHVNIVHMSSIVNSGAYIDNLQPVNVTHSDGSIDQGFIKNDNLTYQEPQMIANIIAELQSLRKRIATLEAK